MGGEISEMTTFTSEDRQAVQKEMNNEPVAWMTETDGVNYFSIMPVKRDAIPLYTHPVKELTDEVWKKAFDFYCETDEGVLKFDLELRDEWKKEQLFRWKEALRKAQEK